MVLKMKYILMQKENGQIKIVDNSTHIGKETIQGLCMKGYQAIGFLESEQRPIKLLGGFNRESYQKLEERGKKLSDIQKILER